eukprot:137593_1
MDLGTIYNKIHRYTVFKKFVHDLLLVWDNCTKYNPKQNLIHQTALSLRDYSLKQLARLCQQDFQSWKDGDLLPTDYPKSSITMEMTMEDEGEDDGIDIKPKPEEATSTITPISYSQTPANNGGNHVNLRDIDEDDDTQMIDNTAANHNHHNHNHNTDEIQHNDVNDEIASNEGLRDPIFSLCDEAEEHQANTLMINHLVEKQELDSNICERLDYNQKEELQRGIQCLDPDHFEPLIEML